MKSELCLETMAEKGRSNTKAKKTGLWGKVFSAVGLAFGAGILVYLALYVRDNVDLPAVLAAVRPCWIAAALLCIPAFELLDAVIFYLMGKGIGSPITLLGCWDATCIGEFYYRLGPPGAPVQLGLMLSAGFSGAAAATVYTFKAVANTVIYGLYAVTALCAKLFYYREDLNWAVWAVSVLVLAYVLICGAVFLVAARPEAVQRVAGRFLDFLARHIRPLGKAGRTRMLKEKLGEFCGDMARMTRSRGLLLRCLGLMLLELTCLFAIPALLYRGLGLSGVSMVDLLLTQVLVSVLSRVVMLPGNAGGAEGSFYLFMTPIFGGALPVALVLWRCAAFLEPMLLGGIWSIVRFFRTAGRKDR